MTAFWNKPDVTFHVLIGLFIKSQIFFFSLGAPQPRHAVEVNRVRLVCVCVSE